MFSTALNKKRAVGLLLLVAILAVFFSFNRFPKLDTVREDLDTVTASQVECFQGFCIESDPDSTFLSRWWDFSVTYLRLVAVGMTFAFVVAGLTEAFFFPEVTGSANPTQGIFKRTLKGLAIGPVMNLCSACIVPVSAAFRKRGVGIEGAIAMVHGSAVLNIPSLVMVALVFTPLLGVSRLVLGLIAALLIGPLVVMVVARGRGDSPDEPEPLQLHIDQKTAPWRPVLAEAFRDWARSTAGFVIRMGPIMVVAGFASGLAIQWINPDMVETYLGNNVQGIAIAATFGLLINVPLLFEIPLVALLLLLGMGTAPAATLLFAAAAGGPITFWGLAKVMPRRAIATFATATWAVGIVGGLGILGLGLFMPGDGTTLRIETAEASGSPGDTVDVAVTDLDGPPDTMLLPLSTLSPTLATTDTLTPALVATPMPVSAPASTPVLTSPLQAVPLPASTRTPTLLPTPVRLQTPVMTAIRFVDVAAAAGVAFQERSRTVKLPLAGGTAIGDYNGDGLLDIYITSSASANALYRNNGDGTFTDVAAAAGVDDPKGHGKGAGWGDYDNDGDLDLFVANFPYSKLFNNSGDGTFAVVTTAAGVGDPDWSYHTNGVAWGDYDRDGFLDLLVVRHFTEDTPETYRREDFSDIARPLALYRNNGDGTFSDVTALLGDARAYPSNIKGAGFKPSFMDYDNDGDPDIYVVNDFGQENYHNVLWRNDGPDGVGQWKFTDVSTEARADVPLYGMGLAVGDYDNDGDFDLYMTDIGDSEFLENQGDGTFANITGQTNTGRGLIPEGGDSGLSVGWGALFADLDNDGLLDLYYVSGLLDIGLPGHPRHQPNALFVNQGDGTFADVSAQTGADDPGLGREAVAADLNNDGLLDIFLLNIGEIDGDPMTTRLFRNVSDATGNWLTIKTIGTTSNRDGIGARITVTTGGVARIREMGLSQGNLSHSVIPGHFGLGTAAHADVVEIRWPSGIVQTITNIAANQVLTVTEPSGK